MTVTLFKVMLPEFTTMPLKVMRSPGAWVLDEQFRLTEMAGEVGTGHEADAVLVTATPVQRSWPMAVTFAVTAQVSATPLSVKFAEPPGARLDVANSRELAANVAI